MAPQIPLSVKVTPLSSIRSCEGREGFTHRSLARPEGADADHTKATGDSPDRHERLGKENKVGLSLARSPSSILCHYRVFHDVPWKRPGSIRKCACRGRVPSQPSSQLTNEPMRPYLEADRYEVLWAVAQKIRQFVAPHILLFLIVSTKPGQATG